MFLPSWAQLTDWRAVSDACLRPSEEKAFTRERTRAYNGGVTHAPRGDNRRQQLQDRCRGEAAGQGGAQARAEQTAGEPADMRFWSSKMFMHCGGESITRFDDRGRICRARVVGEGAVICVQEAFDYEQRAVKETG